VIKYKYVAGNRVSGSFLFSQCEEGAWFFEADLQPREMQTHLFVLETMMELTGNSYTLDDFIAAMRGRVKKFTPETEPPCFLNGKHLPGDSSVRRNERFITSHNMAFGEDGHELIIVLEGLSGNS
jgi:hypothetical protein